MPISDLPTRSQKAKELEVIKLREGVFVVKSQSDPNRTYDVDLWVGGGECTCPDREQRGVICKHIRAAAIKDARGETKDL